jgi:hypothetical protein
MVATDAAGIDQLGRPVQLASAAIHHQAPKSVQIATPAILPRKRAFDTPSPYEKLHQKTNRWLLGFDQTALFYSAFYVA